MHISYIYTTPFKFCVDNCDHRIQCRDGIEGSRIDLGAKPPGGAPPAPASSLMLILRSRPPIHAARLRWTYNRFPPASTAIELHDDEERRFIRRSITIRGPSRQTMHGWRQTWRQTMHIYNTFQVLHVYYICTRIQYLC